MDLFFQGSVVELAPDRHQGRGNEHKGEQNCQVFIIHFARRKALQLPAYFVGVKALLLADAYFRVFVVTLA